MKTDISIIFYTANVLHEPFAGFVRDQLIESINGDYPLIVVSHAPMDFGDKNIVVENPVRGHLQIYRNILTGAKAAKTPFIGLAEDDVCYSWDHWRTHRPQAHRAAYDLSRWGVNSWVRPGLYGYRARPVVNQMIAPTQLVIDCMEERFAKFAGVPDEEIPIRFWAEIGRYEKNLGVTVRELECFAAPTPSVVFSHSEAFGYLSVGERKSVGEFPRRTLPFWGLAETLLKQWDKGLETKIPHYAEV